MDQVLFRIPINVFGWTPDGIPIFGFAVMLCLALLVCIWLAGMRAQKEGVRKEFVPDLAFWVLIGGIAGARLAFLLAEGLPIWHFYRIWEGGLILYGCIPGVLIAYWLGLRFGLGKYGVPTWKLTDIVAPSLAVGIGLGRVGCLLNGCCYGEVACPDCPAVHFPLSGPARYVLVQLGYQTAAGFTISREEPVTVGAVEPDSPAARSGLRAGDVILEADEHEIKSYHTLSSYLADPGNWPRGKATLALKVVHAGKAEAEQLPPFTPWTIGLHPTQVYETISMALLFLLLTAYFPFRRHYGEVMALCLLCYGVHRFFNEMLRSDRRPTDFESYVSVLLIVVGLGLFVWRRWLTSQSVRAEAAAL
jgi:phosphatidylglycerol:prolipoprotein diacylglycerol transferase